MPFCFKNFSNVIKEGGQYIAESFLAKIFGNIGTVGDMETEIKFFVQKINNA